jgi:hypothetical protein
MNFWCKSHKLTGTSDMMHVQRINLLFSASKQGVCIIKGEEYEDVAVGVGCEKCSNRSTIETMCSPFGKLRRVNSLGSDTQFQSEGYRFIYIHAL